MWHKQAHGLAYNAMMVKQVMHDKIFLHLVANGTCVLVQTTMNIQAYQQPWFKYYKITSIACS